jgi:hypothetical protein
VQEENDLWIFFAVVFRRNKKCVACPQVNFLLTFLK